MFLRVPMLVHAVPKRPVRAEPKAYKLLLLPMSWMIKMLINAMRVVESSCIVRSTCYSACSTNSRASVLERGPFQALRAGVLSRCRGGVRLQLRGCSGR